MATTKKKATGKPTIDVNLVVVETSDLEIAIDTASKIGVEPQTETTDPVKLVKLGVLLAQKPASTTITGHTITLTDNVFILDLVKILQGGTITQDTDGNDVYSPPVAGSSDKGQIFKLSAYSAVYDASGQIVEYEKTTFPNCQGTPITINSEDNVFRVPEYTINSAPKTGEAPYTITYVDALPDFSTSDSSVEQQSLETTQAHGRTYKTDESQTGIATMPEKDTDLSEI